MLTVTTPQRSRLEYPASTDSAAKRTIRIGLAGCGVVGGSLVRLVQASAGALLRQHGVRFEIASILVRNVARDRGLHVRRELFTDDLNSFLSTPVDVVVEAIGGQEPAFTIASTALRRGNRFITANKELVSSQGARLGTIASASGAEFDFDAAVGGGAPVLRTLRDAIAAERPASLRGILNGTSNFVLTELERGTSFDTAIARARARGLAEDDYSRDLDGRDAAAKISILAWRAYGVNPSTIPVQRIGLLPDTARFVRHAARLGGSVRLIAECTVLQNSQIAVSVLPTIVPSDGALGRTVWEENRIELELGWSAPLSITAPGAGGAPTATALLSDLLNTRAQIPDACAHEHGNYSAALDPRPHRWLIAATAGVPRVLEALRTQSHENIEHDQSTGETSLTTGPLTIGEVESIVANLRVADANLIVARLALPTITGLVQ